MTNIVTIGSATVDVFVECDEANIVSVATKNKNSTFMSYPYGSKMDITNFSSNVGGGGVNTAVNFANLGFNTSAIFKIGDDIYSEGILNNLKNTKVDLSSIIYDKNLSTGFSIILVSFQGDRTVLAHRGTNAKILKSEIDFNKLKNADFLYIAPLNGESNKILPSLINFAKENNIKTCFNVGTTSLKKGWKYIEKILQDVHIVVLNKEEATICTNTEVRPDTKDEKFSDNIIHPDIITMLNKLKVRDYQVVVITDGGNGAYAFDGKNYYFCPVFNSKVISTLGAGDAFASTFCAALSRTNKNVGESLMYASVNSASVVSKFGATEGLLNFDKIELKLKNTPDYNFVKVE